MNRVTLQRDEVAEALARGEGREGRFCRLLEEGEILFFPSTPFDFPQDEIDFLLSQKQVGASYHKNIAYRPLENRVTGFVKESPEDQKRLLEIMTRYSQRVQGFLGELLEPYASSWRLEYASFRPQQEKGRNLRMSARNDLLHVDAFPTRPTHGFRILRFFTNINPAEARKWITTDPFERIMGDWSGDQGMPLPQPRSWWQSAASGLARSARKLGLPVAARSQYDEFMLGFHHYLKSNQRFQNECPRYESDFPPGSSWMVFTDTVPHAALSGQFALEQTILISPRSLLLPEKSPLQVLERRCGFRLVDPGAWA